MPKHRPQKTTSFFFPGVISRSWAVQSSINSATARHTHAQLLAGYTPLGRPRSEAISGFQSSSKPRSVSYGTQLGAWSFNGQRGCSIGNSYLLRTGSLPQMPLVLRLWPPVSGSAKHTTFTISPSHCSSIGSTDSLPQTPLSYDPDSTHLNR